MRMALITDLHLGLTTTAEYHNRLLGDQAEEITSAAVAALNRSGVDLVVILGDISNASRESELATTRGLFSRLQMPWYVLPGNHDDAAVRSGAFDKIFGWHVAREYIRWGSAGLLFLRDINPDASPVSTSFVIGDRQSSALIASAVADDPTLILVFAHAPLVSAKSRADTHGGHYAGHFADGAAFVEQLAARCAPRRPFIFCGHLHFNHVLATPRWVQCTTGALIEYPMELRRVMLTAGHVTSETLPAVKPDLSSRSLLSADSAWTAGQMGDRQWREAVQ